MSYVWALLKERSSLLVGGLAVNDGFETQGWAAVVPGVDFDRRPVFGVSEVPFIAEQTYTDHLELPSGKYLSARSSGMRNSWISAIGPSSVSLVTFLTREMSFSLSNFMVRMYGM